MAKKHRGKSKSVYLMIGIIIVAGVFAIVTLSSASNVEILGVKTNYNIGKIFNLFEGSQLAVAKSDIIKCYTGISLYGISETDRRVLLSTTSSQIGQPYTVLDITTVGGTKLKSLEVKPFISCESTSATYYPNLVGGYAQVTWEVSKQDGSKVKLLDSRRIDIPITGQNIAGKTYTLGTFSFTKDEIENKLDVGGLNTLAGTKNFLSLQTVWVNGKINLLQGTAKLPVWYYGLYALTSYSLNVQPVNPLAAVTGQKVELKVDSPTDFKVNLNGYRVVTLIGTLDKWTAEEGNPTLKLFYTDPTALASEKTTPLFVKLLSPSTATSAETKFTSGFAFSKTAKHGEYTFEFSSFKRVTVAKASVYVSESPITAPTPKEKCTPPLVEMTDGNCAIVDPPLNGGNPSPEQVCQGTDLSSCLPPFPNLSEILSKNMSWIIILILFLIMVLVLKRAFSGGKKGITIS